MPRSSIADRIYRTLQRLLPGEFRGDFGEDMRADFGARLADEGASRAIRHEAGPLLATAIREHLGILRRDVRDALRTMRRAPGFTALAVLMLALGTGVNVAMFSVVDAVMLRSPFVDRERIATVLIAHPNERGGTSWSAAVPQATFDAIAASPLIDAIGGLDSGTHLLTGAGDPRLIRLECVTAAMFAVTGTPPQVGRVFSVGDDRPGAAPVVVLSHAFARELGEPSQLVGTTITLNRTPVTIVGVMPHGYGGVRSSARVSGWMPAHTTVSSDRYVGCTPGADWNAFARVREGVSLAAATAAFPGVIFEPIDELTFGDRRPSLLILTVAVACVLLIACLNVGGLQLERSLARRREFAVRAALGATRARLIRQALTENLVLAVFGAIAAIAATSLSLGAIVSLLPANLPHLDEIAINGRGVLAACAFATCAGLIAGAIPVVHTRQTGISHDLTTVSRAATARGAGTRRVLVVVEIALSLVVLIGAGLMIRTFATLRPTHPGFDPTGKLVTQVHVTGAPAPRQAAAFDRVFESLRGVPGVRGVEASSYLPLSGTTQMRSITFDGRPVRPFTGAVVTPGYFDLMTIPIRAGRGFTDADAAAAPRVAIVNQSLAVQLRPDGQVIGLTLRTAASRAAAEPEAEWTIVGVAADTRSLSSNLDARPEYYTPLAQRPVPSLHTMVLTDRWRDPAMAAEVRAAIRSALPDLPLEPVQRLDLMLDQGVATPRFGAWLLGVFASLAIALAAIGLMTTMGWWVRQRTRELGVRVALGASRAQVMRLVLRQGVAIALSGIGAGMLVAAGVTRYLQGWIYGVSPLDPATFAVTAAAMLVITIAAVYVPARRALVVDPVMALRAE